jgi:RNA polymerase sigma factor (sigma-70 family)
MPALVRCLRRTAGAEVPDATLLERFVRERDEAAFELLVWRHQRQVLGVCYGVLGRHHDAEDAFQATFLALARKASSIARRPALGPWLRRVAYRVALRASARRARRLTDEQQAAREAHVSAEPSVGVMRADLERLLHEEMDRIAEKYRVPLVLCYLEGHTNEQVARRLGCPAGTIATRLARGRKLLRSRLARRGIGLAGGLMPVALTEFAQAAPQLVRDTVRAALSPHDLISPRVAGLTEEALRSMSMMKLKLAAACVLTVGLLTVGAGVVSAQRQPPQPIAAPAPDQVVNLDSPNEDDAKPAEAPKDAKPNKDQGQHKVTEKITKSFKTGLAPRVILETFNGDVTIKANSKNGVSVELTQEGRGETDEAAREALKALDIKITDGTDEVHITAQLKYEAKKKNVQAGVSADIVVPAGAVLELRTHNGGMKLAGGSGKVVLTTSNGGIDVRDAAGPLKLTTSNGQIRVAGGAGPTELNTRNGSIDIQRDKAVVTANTSNGGITFKGSLAEGNHTFKTSNGGIALSLPTDSRFRVDASTSLGTVSSDFTPTEGKKKMGAHLQATVGDNPKTSITAQTSLGSITLRKAEK